MRFARTELLRLVQQAFSAENPSKNDVFQPDRRDFLKKAAIGSAAFSASPAQFFKKIGSTQPKIAIVGAGLAGLSAAWHLKKAGLEATVFEGSGRIGGRVMTVRNWAGPNIWTDLGGEFVDENHEDVLKLAEALSLAVVDLRNTEGFKLPTVVEFGGKKVSEAEIVEAFLPVRSAILADQKSLPDDPSYRTAAKIKAFDDLSIAEYLTKKGLSGWFFDFLCKAFELEFGLAAAEQSALNLLLTLKVPEKTAQKAEVINGAGSEIFKINGGSQALAERLAEALAPSKVILNERLIQIETVAEGTALWFDTGRRETFDFVVTTLPFPKMREIGLKFEMSERKKTAIKELGMSNSSKLVMAFMEKKWLAAGFSGKAFSDQKFASGWDSTIGQDSTIGTWTAFSGGAEAEELRKNDRRKNVEVCLPSLENRWPGAHKSYFGKAIQYTWGDFKWSQGGYAAYRKGHWQAFAGAEGEPEGAVFFAGEHCDLEFQGFMNGACRSGRVAAEAIAAKIAEKK